MNVKEAFDELTLGGEFESVILIPEYGRCVYFNDVDTIKIFRPQLTRGFTSQIIQGEMGFFLRQDWTTTKRERLSARPNSLSICHLMNFPELIRLSAISMQGIRHEFKSLLLDYLRLLPNREDDVIKAFGKDFFLKDVLQRNLSLATWLRAARVR